ncbi:peptidylprolyl isomerase [Mangrovimonas yunxiaonensis]|uniref:Periplasmic chaperone PpiD n=1 Tax=Mangrovimonas yunxiaonensis TaxID=1197477 RepID=A0A084TLP0_9FLAO|nr:SurA N-terminal domain-containing protein [Mangrovimonas yunxiaonensis]KFB01626.1 peptidylprolyl isomerase [Mangrovimonas yunxiaonensis]GGH35578.1 peptidylprolyl isomerase [Mangrovimonas yunxiaonensis]
MAVLNNIRKRGLFLIIVIALALFSFVLADLFRNSDALMSKSQNVVATINGKDITREDFMQKVELAQRQMGGAGTTTQAMNRVWDQELRQAVLETQFEKLGLSIETDEMRDLLRTSLATNPNFQNEAGLFDEAKLNEYIANLKATSEIAYAQWVDYENSIATNSLQQDYFNMVKAGMMGTVAEGELEYKLQNDKIDIKFVQLPYASIPDSTITVSKGDIQNYIKAHAAEFKVDETRDLRYVKFEEVASVADEDQIKADLEELLKGRVEYNETTKANDTVQGFGTATDNKAFINANSDIKFNDRFQFKSEISKAIVDSVYNLNVGDVYGPYKDAGFLKLTKLIATKNLPDSAQARHILIPFVGAASAAADVTQTEAQAKATADSLLSVLKTDITKFDTFVTDFSSDLGSVENGGRYEYFGYNRMVPEFRDFVFENNKGDLGVVKSNFGFHIIEVEGHKNTQKVVKLGTIARKIEASEATIDKVFADVSNFEIALENKDFETLANENSYAVRPVNGVKALDENIPGLNAQRQIVRWAFEEGTKVGDYKRFTVSNGFVVVQVTAKHKAGLMDVEQASVNVLPKLRKEKKAAQIRERISATTLQDLATAENTTVKTSMAINMKNPTISGAGSEPLVVGQAFALNEGQTSGLINGDKGVYMVEVTKKTPAVDLENYQGFSFQVEQQKANSVNSKLYEALKEASEIEDNRANTVQ